MIPPVKKPFTLPAPEFKQEFFYQCQDPQRTDEINEEKDPMDHLPTELQVHAAWHAWHVKSSGLKT